MRVARRSLPIFLLLLATVPAWAQSGKLYWTTALTDQIKRADLDGANATVLVDTSSPPESIQLDLTHAKMYWLQAPVTIYRANTSGSLVESLVQIPDAWFGTAVYAVDGEGGKVYFGQDRQEDAGQIGRVNLDGTGLEIIVPDVTTRGIELDVPNGKMYFSYWNPFDDLRELRRANLDGANVETLFSFEEFPLALALDLAGGKIYWVAAAPAIQEIKRANLDGTDVEVLITGLDDVHALEVDAAGGKLYYMRFDIDVRRANLDGSGDEAVVVDGGVRGLALDPSGDASEPVPALGGRGAVLTGLLLLLASTLYLRRSPQDRGRVRN